MKLMMVIPLLILNFFTLPLFADDAATAKGSVSVSVTGMTSDVGMADIALVNSKEQLKSDDEKPFMGGRSKINGGSASYTFTSVPYGTYAIKVFHDENDNGVLDKGAFGIPKEEYGFSNIPASKKGRPSFEKAAFDLNSSKLDITIETK